MPKTSPYCKAYPTARFESFGGWNKTDPNEREHGGDDQAAHRTKYLFLHSNFVVTDGIFVDENVVFEAVTPEWTDFCTNELAFDPQGKTGNSAPAEQIKAVSR